MANCVVILIVVLLNVVSASAVDCSILQCGACGETEGCQELNTSCIGKHFYDDIPRYPVSLGEEPSSPQRSCNCGNCAQYDEQQMIPLTVELHHYLNRTYFILTVQWKPPSSEITDYTVVLSPDPTDSCTDVVNDEHYPPHWYYRQCISVPSDATAVNFTVEYRGDHINCPEYVHIKLTACSGPVGTARVHVPTTCHRVHPAECSLCGEQKTLDVPKPTNVSASLGVDGCMFISWEVGGHYHRPYPTASLAFYLIITEYTNNPEDDERKVTPTLEVLGRTNATLQLSSSLTYSVKVSMYDCACGRSSVIGPVSLSERSSVCDPTPTTEAVNTTYSTDMTMSISVDDTVTTSGVFPPAMTPPGTTSTSVLAPTTIQASPTNTASVDTSTLPSATMLVRHSSSVDTSTLPSASMSVRHSSSVDTSTLPSASMSVRHSSSVDTSTLPSASMSVRHSSSVDTSTLPSATMSVRHSSSVDTSTLPSATMSVRHSSSVDTSTLPSATMSVRHSSRSPESIIPVTVVPVVFLAAVAIVATLVLVLYVYQRHKDADSECVSTQTEVEKDLNSWSGGSTPEGDRKFTELTHSVQYDIKPSTIPSDTPPPHPPILDTYPHPEPKPSALVIYSPHTPQRDKDPHREPNPLPFTELTHNVPNLVPKPSALVIYSPHTPQRDKEVILELLVKQLPKNGVRVVCEATENIRGSLPRWVEAQVRDCTAVVCVCNQEFYQEWEGNSEPRCKSLVYPLRDLVMAAVIKSEDRSNYITVLLRENHRHIPDFLLTCPGPIIFDNSTSVAENVARYILNVPEYKIDNA